MGRAGALSPAYLDRINNKGYNALMYASMEGKEEFIHDLLLLHANTNVRNTVSGNSALINASHSGTDVCFIVYL